MNKKSMKHAMLGTLALLTTAGMAWAAVPSQVAFQGRISVDGVNFDGAGDFKFAIVNADGTETYWSNDGTSEEGSAPESSVTLPVHRGLYSVLLGGAGMEPIDASVFAEAEGASLRVWFDDGENGSQLLSPDQEFASVPTALVAGTAQVAESANSLSEDYKLDIGNFSEELQGVLEGVSGVGETLADQQERIEHLSAWQNSFAPIISLDEVGTLVVSAGGAAQSRSFSVSNNGDVSVNVSFSTDFEWLTYDSDTNTITAEPGADEPVGVTVVATISATNLAGTTTVSFDIEIVAEPTEAPTVDTGAIGDRVVFTGESISFGIPAAPGPITGYNISSDGGLGGAVSLEGNTVTVNASGVAEGVYVLGLTATNAAGTSDEGTIRVRVANKPTEKPNVTRATAANIDNNNLALVVDSEMADVVTTASNGPIIEFTYSGSTPVGLSFTGPDFEDDTLTLSGTPTQTTDGTRINGNFRARNVVDWSENRAFSIWIVDQPAIQNVEELNFSVMATDSLNYQVVASHPQGDPNTDNRPSPSHSGYELVGEPGWISINSAGRLTGTAPVVEEDESWTFTVAVENVAGWSIPEEVTVTATPLQPVTQILVAAEAVQANVGQDFQYQIEANHVPTSYSATGLPSGLSVNTESGVISGQPASGTEGVYSVVIGASNAEGGTFTNLDINVLPPAPIITSPPTWSANVDTASSNYYRIQANHVTVTEGSGDDQVTVPAPGLEYSAKIKDGEGLPDGLQINADTGIISATGDGPSTGTYELTISVSTDFGSDSKTLRLILFR